MTDPRNDPHVVVDRRDACATEKREFLLRFDAADKIEGVRAFREKRRPSFAGN